MTSFTSRRVTVLQVLALASVAVALAFAAPALSKTTASQTGKPRVSTGSVAHPQASSGELEGTVNPNGLATSYYFQYGPTNAYGATTPTLNLASGTTTVKVGQTVTGLATGYHYRLVASNGDGQTFGKDKIFAGAKKRLQFTFAKVKQRLVGYRGTYVLSGTLTGLGNGNHPIALQSIPYPFKVPYATVGVPIVTGPTGAFSFRIPDMTQNTKFRVEVLGTRPTYSSVLPVNVAVKVTIHVHAVTHVGLARVYGTVAPGSLGGVIVQALKPAKETGKREATGPRAVSVGIGKLKHATATLSRFSVVVHIASTGHYRVYVRLAKGALVSGYSPDILIRTSVAPTKSKKSNGKSKQG
jgi:hypothetical protein